jgi:hypothetical protein
VVAQRWNVTQFKTEVVDYLGREVAAAEASGF